MSATERRNVVSRLGRTPPIDDYAKVVGQAEVRDLRVLAARLKGKRVKMVNSTAVGGGVAEILNRLVPLLNELELPTSWEVLRGGKEFFAITKAFHNALHGAPYKGGQDWFEKFLATNDENRRQMTFDEDFVVIHDPQPVGLIQSRAQSQSKWIWRCHIDLSVANEEVWNFLKRFVVEYDVSLFSSPAFTKGLPIPQYLFYPPIDPLAEKNRDLEPEDIRGVMERFGVDVKRPILTQVSRFDRLKDPVGVIKAYRMVRKYHDCQLVLAGGGADDDPESAQVLHEVNEAANADPDIHILNLPPHSDLEINALQRGSTVIVQKSLREGFGLTVSEALWKKKAVVASAIGGIPSQVIHKLTGLLVHSIEGTAYQVRLLLSDPKMAKGLGDRGHEHVKENFLISHSLARYMGMFLGLRN